MPKTSDSIGIKISELGDAGVIKENDVVPINAKTSAGVPFTKSTKINDIRQTLGFENAFLSVDAGLNGTASGDVFFVYESAAKLWVLQYQNNDGVANPILGYDNEQVRLPTSRMIKSSSDSISSITSDIGLSKIGTVKSISDLRNLELKNLGDQVFLAEHTEGSGIGGGIFYLHSLSSVNFVDDNGCQIISNNGCVYRRKNLNDIRTSYFGLKPKGIIDDVLDKMYLASRTFKIYDVFIDDPGFDSYYILNGGKRYYVGDAPFYIHGATPGSFRGPCLYHTGDNIGITFSRFTTGGSTKETWSGGGISGIRFWGKSPDLGTNNTGESATAIRFSDMWNGRISDIWITGYNGNISGAGISLYNEFAWTEGTVVENIMIRGSVRGITLLRSSNPSATDSFFRTKIELSMNAGIGGTSTKVMVIGDGTKERQCLLYGFEIELTQWMSAGSWHDIIRLEDYSIVDNGKFILSADGYGISKTVVPSGEVVHFINVRGQNARFRGTVESRGSQAGGWGLDFLDIVFQSNIYTKAVPFFESDWDALPPINPVGMKIGFNGTFTVAERISGKVYTLANLIPGMTLRVKLTSREGNNKYNISVQEWIVVVRSSDLPCIVSPVAGVPNVTTSSALALTDTSGKTDNFLKGVTLSNDRNFVGQANGLTVKNANDDNNLSWAFNSGRKIRFVLPAYSGATTDCPYSVMIEVI